MTDKIIIKNESKATIQKAMQCGEAVINLGKLSRHQHGNSFTHASQFVEDGLVAYCELRKSGTIKFRVCNR